MTTTSRPPIRRSTVAAVVVLVALVPGAGACGLSEDAGPRDIPADRLNDAVSPIGATTTTQPAPSPDPGEVVAVYLIDEEGELRPRNRLTGDDGIASRLAELGRQDPGDADRGLVTLVPAETALAGVPELTGTTLVLPLTEDFYRLEGENRSRAAAQVVFTLTTRPDVTEVLFVDGDGEARNVATSAGVIPDEPRPMDRRDFTGFDPLRSTDS